MFGIGGFELFLILLFGFLVFGPDKLPAIAKTIGKAIAKFRDAQEEMTGQLKKESFIDKDSDEPFKNPLDVIEKASNDAKSGIKKAKKKADEVTDKIADAAESSSEDDGSTDASKDQPVENEHVASFAERKAKYDKERAARKAAEAEKAKEAEAQSAAKEEAKSNPKTEVAKKSAVEANDAKKPSTSAKSSVTDAAKSGEGE